MGVRRTRRGRCLGFSLIEILIVSAIISVLSALLLPTLRSTKERANRVKCINNLKQLGMAVHMYANDHDGNCPEYDGDIWWSWNLNNTQGDIHDLWQVLYPKYVSKGQLFFCPSNTYITYTNHFVFNGNNRSSYNYIFQNPPFWWNVRTVRRVDDINTRMDPASGFSYPLQYYPIIFDGTNQDSWNGRANHFPQMNRREGGHFLFMDGSVRWMKPGDQGYVNQSDMGGHGLT